MRIRLVLLAVLCGASSLGAQRFQLADGTWLLADEVSLQGSQLVRSIAVTGENATVERAYPLAQVVRLDWPEPDALQQARNLLLQGRGEDARQVIEPVYIEFAPYARIAGSWWAAAALVRMEALLLANQDRAAGVAAREIVGLEAGLEATGLARLALTELELRLGRIELARAMLDTVMADELPEAVTAKAWLLRGELAFREKSFEDAIDAYLHVPVLHGTRRDLIPVALLGAARSFRLLEDYPALLRVVAELERDYPESRQLSEARKLVLPSSP